MLIEADDYENYLRRDLKIRRRLLFLCPLLGGLKVSLPIATQLFYSKMMHQSNTQIDVEICFKFSVRHLIGFPILQTN